MSVSVVGLHVRGYLISSLCVALRLRKNLKCLIIAHPSWFIRTVLAISRPFLRSAYQLFVLFLLWWTLTTERYIAQNTF